MPGRLVDALRTVEDFTSVQRGADPATLMDAVLRLQSAVGIDDEVRVVLRDGLEELDRSAEGGAVLLGLVLGLWAAGEGPTHPLTAEADL